MNRNLKIYAKDLDTKVLKQINDISDAVPYINEKIRIMPDTHLGAGCVIGFTSTLGDKICPDTIGVDIGCGISAFPFYCEEKMDFAKIEKFIRKNIPSGFNINKDINSGSMLGMSYINNLKCYNELYQDEDYFVRSLGTLGGGNHFIEIGKSEKEKDLYYLFVHSGSRKLGSTVHKIYNKKLTFDNNIAKQIEELISNYKEQSREKEIQSAIDKIRENSGTTEMGYLQGQLKRNYVNDVAQVCTYAKINRMLILDTILLFLRKEYTIFTGDFVDIPHNYIENDYLHQKGYIRKGAISACKGEKVIIPLNMRDGVILGKGKGNEDWNCSAPHGAGRLMSRTEAKKSISIKDFENEMKDVYTESVCGGTLDEAPEAYKNKDDIINLIKETVEITDIIKPVYNFKDKGVLIWK